jgi:ABC-type branched-subunit amino acid transport system ATPase component
MTVLENLEMGAYAIRGRSEWQRNLDRIYTLFPVLAERRSQLAGTLSGGEQQMLAIGRGMASAPRLLLLDEPSMGLAPAIADLIFDRIAALHQEDRATLLLSSSASRKRSNPATTGMYWRPGASSSKARAARWWPTPACAGLISEFEETSSSEQAAVLRGEAA